MKKIYLFLLIISLLTLSCEQVVTIDLNDASPALVVEGRIYADSLAVVELHETGSFFIPDTQLGVTDALVIVSSPAEALSDTLVHDTNGIYRGTHLLGRTGKTYELYIEHAQKIYEAESRMNETPQILSLSQRSFASFGDFGSDSGGFDIGGGSEFLDSLPYFLFTNIREDSTQDNYFLIRYCVNGVDEGGNYNVTDDDNAGPDTLAYSPGPTALFYPGDTVGVRVYAIDADIYRYFDSLNDALSSNPFFSSTPYNPVSNISGGGLGYFAAMSFDCRDTVISAPEIPIGF